MEATTIEIKLAAYNLGLYYAWQRYFSNKQNVIILDDDILKHRANAIVSPANSFGYMDGGLDLKYSQHFGWDLEKRVRAHLEAHYWGELPVGQAILIETGRDDIPWLISAPTMRVPSDVSNTVNAYLAFKAILQCVLTHNHEQADNRVDSLLCPGLGTGEGRMPYEKCARQMRRAYDVCIERRFEREGGLVNAVNDHIYLMQDERPLE